MDAFIYLLLLSVYVFVVFVIKTEFGEGGGIMSMELVLLWPKPKAWT